MILMPIQVEKHLDHVSFPLGATEELFLPGLTRVWVLCLLSMLCKACKMVLHCSDGDYKRLACTVLLFYNCEIFQTYRVVRIIK